MNRDGGKINNDWQTPKWFYDQLDKEFSFDFDPCPYQANFDGLKIEWGRSNFINPPYDKVNKPLFIEKAFSEWKKGKTCVMLIPASTSTKHFHEYILPYAEIRWVKGRIGFIGYNTKGILVNGDGCQKEAGKHDSMIVIFRPKEQE